MTWRTFASPFGLALTAAALASCSIFDPPSGGLQGVDDLADRIQRVHVDAELAGQNVAAALAALQAVAAPEFRGDALAAHGQLVQAVQQSELQADALRSAITAMKDAAEPVFQEWGEDLLEFHRADLRQRSQARLADARQRYHEIVATVEPAQTTLDAINLNLRDLALFLGNDLNTGATAAVQQDVNAAAELVVELDGRLAASRQAALAYLVSAALPGLPEGTAATPTRSN